MFSYDFLRRGRAPMLALAFAITLTACESKMDKAIDQAKLQASSTGQPQQVVAVDKSGTTTTTVVQPPAKGQTAGSIATTSTPPPPGGPVPPPQDPKVMPLGDPNQAQADDQGSGSRKAAPSGPVVRRQVSINGKRITRHTLRDGDAVAIGKTTFRFAVRPMKESRQ